MFIRRRQTLAGIAALTALPLTGAAGRAAPNPPATTADLPIGELPRAVAWADLENFYLDDAQLPIPDDFYDLRTFIAVEDGYLVHAAEEYAETSMLMFVRSNGEVEYLFEGNMQHDPVISADGSLIGWGGSPNGSDLVTLVIADAQTGEIHAKLERAGPQLRLIPGGFIGERLVFTERRWDDDGYTASTVGYWDGDVPVTLHEQAQATAVSDANGLIAVMEGVDGGPSVVIDVQGGAPAWSPPRHHDVRGFTPDGAYAFTYAEATESGAIVDGGTGERLVELHEAVLGLQHGWEDDNALLLRAYLDDARQYALMRCTVDAEFEFAVPPEDSWDPRVPLTLSKPSS